MILNLAGFVFHAIASRKLGVADYGTLYALISLFSLASMPGLIFGPVISRFAAEFRALHDDRHVRGLVVLIVRAFGIIGAIYIIVAVVGAAPLSSFMHVPRWGILFVGIVTATGLFSAALRALAQGTHNFAAFAGSSIAEGLGKVAAVLAFAFAGLTLFNSSSGFLIGVLVGLVVMAIPLLRRYGNVEPLPIRLDWARILATTGGAASLAITGAIIGYADVILVKHYFGAQDAGLYSAASLGGKILLYFVGFVPAVLIPHATDRYSRGERTREMIALALIFIGATGVFGVVAYRFFGTYLLHALVGTAFDASLPILIGYAVAMALLAATIALGSYAIATHRLAFAAPLLLATGGTLAVIAVSHPTLQVVVNELIAGNAVMLIFVAIALGWQGFYTRSDR